MRSSNSSPTDVTEAVHGQERDTSTPAVQRIAVNSIFRRNCALKSDIIESTGKNRCYGPAACNIDLLKGCIVELTLPPLDPVW
jgi:hypothetical protein